MSRKFITVFMVLAMLLVFVPTASAAPAVILDGHTLSFDVPPTIENGRTLVPLRAIFEALGTQIYWDAPTQTVMARKESANTVISLTIGNKYAYVNNNLVQLDVPAKIIKSRTMVPLRFVSEALGAKVDWDGVTQTINITSALELFEVAQDGVVIGHYSGAMKDGVPNGQGIFIDLQGVKYIGQFSNGINTGDWTSGTIQWPDNTVYTGALQKGNLKGAGKLTTPTGIKFIGQFNGNNIRDWTAGTIQWPDGKTYSGALKAMKAQGQGQIDWPEGAEYKRYLGDFSVGMMEGQGSLLFADGHSYTGSFSANQATGTGTLNWPKEGVHYEGQVKDGLMEGQGVLKTTHGELYTGQFKNNLADGQGTLLFADGQEYSGQFAQGKPNGTGKMTYPDGRSQEGQWINGVFQG